MALPVVLALMLLLFIGVSSINGTAVQTLGVTNVSAADVRAVYAAEAGLRDALSQLKLNPAWTTGFTSKKLPTERGSAYTVVVTPGPANVGGAVVPAGFDFLLATGTASEGSRTFSRRVSGIANRNGSFFKYGIFGDAHVTLNGSGTSTTSLGTNQASSAVTLNPSSIAVGTATYSAGMSMPSITAPTGTVFQPLTVGNGKTTTLSAGTYYFGNVSIKGTLTVSSGPVVIYLNGDWTSSGGVINNASGNPADLQVYATDNVTNVSMTGGSQAAMGIYAPKATLTISGNGSNSPVFQGSAVARQIVANGGISILYDPRLSSAAPLGQGLWQISGFHRL